MSFDFFQPVNPGLFVSWYELSIFLDQFLKKVLVRFKAGKMIKVDKAIIPEPSLRKGLAEIELNRGVMSFIWRLRETGDEIVDRLAIKQNETIVKALPGDNFAFMIRTPPNAGLFYWIQEPNTTSVVIFVLFLILEYRIHSRI
jgi:hypothetical protein